MIVAEKLWVLKLNHRRNITLLHTALNCTQMMCVMTCSAERGIHQETIELVQKNTQLQETSLTDCRNGRCMLQGTPWTQNRYCQVLTEQGEGNNYLEKVVVNWVRLKCYSILNTNAAKRRSVDMRWQDIEVDEKQQESFLRQLWFGSPSAFSWHLTGKGQEGRELLTV